MRQRRLAAFVMFAVISGVGSRVATQNGAAATAFLPQAKLVTPGEVNDFGGNVAVSGTTVVVGAATSPPGIGRGAAFVFVQVGTTWALQDDLVPSDPGDGDVFGSSVAISGETAVVGAPRDDIAGTTNQGSAYVFLRNGTTWTEQQRLVAPTAFTVAEFGRAVAIDGNTVAVGAPGDLGRGAVYVFVRSGTQWSLQQQLVAPDGVSGDLFGFTLSLSGNTIVVGALGDDVGAQVDQGSAYVFVRSGTTWSFQQQFFAGDGGTSDSFSAGVAVSGDRALIGAPFHNTGGVVDQGAAYMFVRTGTAWALEQKLAADDGDTNDGFGQRVALQGLVAVVGAPLRGDGVAYVFRRTPAGWTQRETLRPIDLTSRFGVVAIDGPIVVAGAPENGRRLGPGSTYIFAEQVVNGALTPGAPVLSPAIVTGSTVQLTWTATAGAARYQLRAGTSPGSSNAFNGDVGNTTSITAVNVATGSYFVRVHAVDPRGESGPSNEVRVDVGVAAPCVVSAPTNLQFTVAGRVVTLTWTGAAGAESYVVEAGSSSGTSNLASFDTNSAATVFVANAPPGRYFVRVKSKRSCGISAPSNQVEILVS